MTSEAPLAPAHDAARPGLDPPRVMSERLGRYRHIAIEGPIGAGKTTLAGRLADHLGAELMLEQPAENPFLWRFYQDRAGYAFQTQLFFLFQRERQMRTLSQPSMFSQTVVSDFMFAKDALFARLNLSDEEYRLYAQMHQPIAAQLREPDLVLWLQASASSFWSCEMRHVKEPRPTDRKTSTTSRPMAVSRPIRITGTTPEM